MHERSILCKPVPVRDWRPEFPAGTIRTVVLHWTAGDYETVYRAYHFCLSGAADVGVVATSDLRANMRDVREHPQREYAAHTQGRNSYAVGIAICAMRDAAPHDFGNYPLTREQVDALCVVAARVMRAYRLPPGAILTHAEAALEDGYFGAGSDDVRWDIARLAPSPQPLVRADAEAAGDHLRARIAALA